MAAMIDHTHITRKLVADGIRLPVATRRPRFRSEAQKASINAARKVHREMRKERMARARQKSMTPDDLQKMGFTMAEISALKRMELSEVVRLLWTERYPK
jgi:hypothetical protein